MKRSSALLAVAMVLMLPLTLLGWGGPVMGPELGFPKDASKETIEKVLNYLRTQVNFIDGSFINEFTSQKYAASAKKLGGLIELLHASGFEVQVTFADLKNDRAAFILAQNGHDDAKVSIAINTTRKDFDLTGLTIQLPARRR